MSIGFEPISFFRTRINSPPLKPFSQLILIWCEMMDSNHRAFQKGFTVPRNRPLCQSHKIVFKVASIRLTDYAVSANGGGHLPKVYSIKVRVASYIKNNLAEGGRVELPRLFQARRFSRPFSSPRRFALPYL